MNIYIPEISYFIWRRRQRRRWVRFFVFKFLHTHTVYSSYIIVYASEGKLCRTKVLWVLKFLEVWDPTSKKSKYQQVRGFSIFYFSKCFFVWRRWCGFFLSLNFFILIQYMAYVYITIYVKGKFAEQKFYGFEIMNKLGRELTRKFPKSQQVGRFFTFWVRNLRFLGN